MDTSYVVLGFCLFAWVYAQPEPLPTNIVYDIELGIYDRNQEIHSNESNFRSLCSIGSTVYHSEGGNIYRNFSLFREGVSDDIQSIACCCNFIAIAYIDNGNTIIIVTELESSPSITIKKNLGAQGGVALKFFKNGDDTWLVVVSQTTLYKYNADDLTSEPVVMESGLSLSSAPRCVACYFDSASMNTYIFVSFNSQQLGHRITFDGNEVIESMTFSPPGAEFVVGVVPGRLSCLDIEDDYIYFVVFVPDSFQPFYAVTSYPISMYAPTLNTSASAVDGRVVARGNMVAPIDSAGNGLSVCGSSCQNTSTCGASCECASTCGVCFNGGDGQCQCSNSLLSNCCYSNSTQAASCTEQIPGVDAFCVVKNHVAMRREGDPVDIVGVTRESLMQEITVKRVVRTGRWKILPFDSAMVNRSNGSLTAEGRSFQVRSSARGMRFGLFAVNVKPTDQTLQPEWIPCIATERSGFLNRIFTATISNNESTMLQATFSRTRLLRFESMVQWRYTPVNSALMQAMTSNAMPVNMDECRGNLTCKATGMRGTAAYECYRPRRDPRTWHPIFLVCVRDCPAGKFGLLCDGNCPMCVNGVCDEATGLCNCYPGFNGTTCNSSCPEGFIGRHCDIACGDVDSDCDDCRNMLLCPARKVGCTCYPGFMAPFCNETCPAGRWGTNCMETCATPCDPRTGEATM